MEGAIKCLHKQRCPPGLSGRPARCESALKPVAEAIAGTLALPGNLSLTENWGLASTPEAITPFTPANQGILDRQNGQLFRF